MINEQIVEKLFQEMTMRLSVFDVLESNEYTKREFISSILVLAAFIAEDVSMSAEKTLKVVLEMDQLTGL